jgi:hypothetical protein
VSDPGVFGGVDEEVEDECGLLCGLHQVEVTSKANNAIRAESGSRGCKEGHEVCRSRARGSNVALALHLPQ